jgi:hypothetical protein
MLHNLTPAPAKVYLTWGVDFVPAAKGQGDRHQGGLPALAGCRRQQLPVFDALRGSGRNGHYGFPEDARGAERRKIGPAHHFTAPAI